MERVENFSHLGREVVNKDSIKEVIKIKYGKVGNFQFGNDYGTGIFGGMHIFCVCIYKI